MIINPRLTDFHGIAAAQSEVDFGIPFLDQDIPLHVDPFLLWKSPAQWEKGLHFSLVNALNHLGYLCKCGKRDEAVRQIVIASECDEVGLGGSGARKGKRISEGKANEILNIFDMVSHYKAYGFRHFEELSFFVEGISKDRISDFACSFLKSTLIDYTMDQCEQLGIPVQTVPVKQLYNSATSTFDYDVPCQLPVNPENSAPILLVPKRWLRYTPWISFDEYFRNHCPLDEKVNPDALLRRIKVLNYNRENFGAVDHFIKLKEKSFSDCVNDPLFRQMPVTSAKQKFQEIERLSTGKGDKADRRYEDLIGQLMASFLYPNLDFAAEQSRTESGALIRDIIFYNNRSHEWLQILYDEYKAKQLVFEVKNVREISGAHINQLHRYLNQEFGNIGFLVTRNPLPRAMLKNTIDLWAAYRKSIICLSDGDIGEMVELFDSKQRLPLDILKKKYIEFTRKLPS